MPSGFQDQYEEYNWDTTLCAPKDFESDLIFNKNAQI
jgi:hypothetical protein